MKIGLASDHAGFKLKKEIIKHLKNKYPKIEVVDFGTKSKEPTDYPIYAKKNAYALRDKEIDRAIFICGSGIGISIAASKVEGVMAPLFHFP
jgi:ribose 5-phosphate isomerase B